MQWRPARNGIADIEGVSPAVIEAFSRRRAEIDAQVADWGRTSAAARQSAALATRARKDYGVTPEMLAGEWRQRARALGLDDRAVDDLLGHGASRTRRFDEIADELVSPRGLTAQASTFDRRDVVQAFAARARQGASLEEIEAATDALLCREEIVTLAAGAGEHVQRADVIRRADGRTVSAIADAPRYSTVELLATEQRVIDDVLQRKGDGVGIADEAALDRALEARPTLGADQATMVRRLCRDGDGVQVVVGPPGTGKTFALDAAREAWQASGFVVSGAAVARQAARGLWDAAGIESTSVAALLGELRPRPRMGPGAANACWSSTRPGCSGPATSPSCSTHAATARAKVVLVGDHHQLPEIDAGGVFRALVARTDPVRLTVNRRQHEPHAREMLDLWRQSRVREAMTIAAEHGELVTSTSAEELHARIVGDYCAAIMRGEDAVMITLRRADARDLNSARPCLASTTPAGSDRIAWTSPAASSRRRSRRAEAQRPAPRRGERQPRTRRRGRREPPARCEVELSGDRTVTLPRGYLARRTARGEPTLVHGYAGTAHIAQGSTTGRAFVLGSDAAYREWGYVAWSRARDADPLLRLRARQPTSTTARSSASAERSTSRADDGAEPRPASGRRARRPRQRRRRPVAYLSRAATRRPTSSRRSAIVPRTPPAPERGTAPSRPSSATAPRTASPIPTRPSASVHRPSRAGRVAPRAARARRGPSGR